MPDQPPDPHHYDMRIPLPADSSMKQDSQKPSDDKSDSEASKDKAGKDSGGSAGTDRNRE